MDPRASAEDRATNGRQTAAYAQYLAIEGTRTQRRESERQMNDSNPNERILFGSVEDSTSTIPQSAGLVTNS